MGDAKSSDGGGRPILPGCPSHHISVLTSSCCTCALVAAATAPPSCASAYNEVFQLFGGNELHRLNGAVGAPRATEQAKPAAAAVAPMLPTVAQAREGAAAKGGKHEHCEHNLVDSGWSYPMERTAVDQGGDILGERRECLQPLSAAQADGGGWHSWRTKAQPCHVAATLLALCTK